MELRDKYKAVLLAHKGDYYAFECVQNAQSAPFINCRFYVDLSTTTVSISGDIGSAVAVWGGNDTLHNIIDYMRNPYYFIEKLRCSSDTWEYSEEDAKQELTSAALDWNEDGGEYIQDGRYIDDLDDIMSEFDETQGIRILSDSQRDSAERLLGPDWGETISSYGRSPHSRVLLWAKCFKFCVEELGLDTQKILWVQV